MLRFPFTLMFSGIFLCLLFHQCIAPPVRSQSSAGGLTENSGTPECFFKTHRKTEYEICDRPEKSKVSETCHGDLKNMKDLLLDVDGLYGARYILDLILFRGGGILVDWDDLSSETWRNKFICEEHYQELYSQWKSKKFKSKHIVFSKGEEACSVPDVFDQKFHIRSGNRKKFKTLQLSDAALVLEKKGVLLHPGIPICSLHMDYIRKMDSHPASQGNQCQIEEDSVMDVEFEMECSEEGEKSVLQQYQPQFGESTVSAFRQFTTSLGIGDTRCNKPLKDASIRTRERKTAATRKVVAAVFKMIAPDWPEFLEETILGSYKPSDEFGCANSLSCRKLMGSITYQYYAASSRIQRIITLSLVVEVLPSKEIRKFLPDISGYMISQAKRFARSVPRQETALIRERFDKRKILSFVEFITSPIIMTGLPYGARTVFNTLGEPIDVPGSVRKFHNARIIQLYEKFLEDRKETELAMSRSTYYKILDVCVATKKHSMTCVDYYYADASEALIEMNELLENWEKRGDIETRERETMKYNLEKYFLYLKTDYRIHVNLTDPVMDHCQKHALSDTSNLKLKTRITHDHDKKCPRCEQGKIVMKSLKDTFEDLLETARNNLILSPNDQVKKEKVNVLEYEQEILVKTERSLEEYKKHMLKSSFTDNERSGLISHINIHSSAFITMDFAQKWLPMEYMEKQSDYFGKRGVSYHISHVISNLEGETVTHSFVHILTGDAQDSVVVTAIIKHMLEELKKVGIDDVYLRSDNAATYKASSVISSLLDISQKTGVNIQRYSYSEVQNGKSDCDRVASYLKAKARRYVNAGGKARDPNEFYAALTENPLKATSIYLGTVVDHEKSKTVIEGITGYNTFVPQEPHGIRAFRYFSMGEGEMFPKQMLTPNKGVFKVEKKGGHLPDGYDLKQAQERIWKKEDTFFWLTKRCLETASCTTEAVDEAEVDVDNDNEDPDTPMDRLFDCPQEGCASTFLTEKNLRRHVIAGKHKYALDKTSMVDYALKSYASQLQGFGSDKAAFSFIKDATEECSSSTNPAFSSAKLLEGWALPTKKTAKRFSPEVRKYLEEIFKEGADSKKRKDPKVVEKEMRNAKKPDGARRFSPEDCLNARQIMSFFGRLNSCKNQRPKRGTEAIDCDQDIEENAFAKEADTTNIDDVYLQEVYEHKDEIFTPGTDNSPFVL